MPANRRAVPGAEPLSGDRIVAAALAMLDDLGPEAFTMRRLADRIGVRPNTIYWHVGKRDRLLALVVDLALSEIAVIPPDSMPWREWLAGMARGYRRTLQAHPNVAPLAASQLLVSPPTLALVELTLARLAEAGFTGHGLAHAFNTFLGSLVGWVSLELADNSEPAGDWQVEFAASVAGLDPAGYPTIAANRAALADRAFTLRWSSGRARPMDDSFEFALDAWLTGIQAALPHPRRRTR